MRTPGLIRYAFALVNVEVLLAEGLRLIMSRKALCFATRFFQNEHTPVITSIARQKGSHKVALIAAPNTMAVGRDCMSLLIIEPTLRGK